MTSARIVLRSGGLGDVVMALAAAKALKQLTGDHILLVTFERYAELARACPHVDRVMVEQHLQPQERKAMELGHGIGRLLDLNAITFGIAREHQVDAFLWAAGLEAPARLKNVDLVLPASKRRSAEQKFAAAGVRPGCVVLHPIDGDPNRTWPAQRWKALTCELLAKGDQVVFIGARDAGTARQSVPEAGVIDLIDRLDPLETVCLLQRSAALVAADSGPVHLAGATETRIVGLFSVVHGANRLPFRHGELGWNAHAIEPACPSSPCYRPLNRPEVISKLRTDAQSSGQTMAQAVGQWCPEPGAQYACMQTQIGIERVMRALDQRSDLAPGGAAAPLPLTSCARAAT